MSSLPDKYNMLKALPNDKLVWQRLSEFPRPEDFSKTKTKPDVHGLNRFRTNTLAALCHAITGDRAPKGASKDDMIDILISWRDGYLDVGLPIPTMWHLHVVELAQYRLDTLSTTTALPRKKNKRCKSSNVRTANSTKSNNSNRDSTKNTTRDSTSSRKKTKRSKPSDGGNAKPSKSTTNTTRHSTSSRKKTKGTKSSNGGTAEPSKSTKNTTRNSTRSKPAQKRKRAPTNVPLVPSKKAKQSPPVPPLPAANGAAIREPIYMYLKRKNVAHLYPQFIQHGISDISRCVDITRDDPPFMSTLNFGDRSSVLRLVAEAKNADAQRLDTGTGRLEVKLSPAAMTKLYQKFKAKCIRKVIHWDNTKSYRKDARGMYDIIANVCSQNIFGPLMSQLDQFGHSRYNTKLMRDKVFQLLSDRDYRGPNGQQLTGMGILAVNPATFVDKAIDETGAYEHGLKFQWTFKKLTDAYDSHDDAAKEVFRDWIHDSNRICDWRKYARKMGDEEKADEMGILPSN